MKKLRELRLVAIICIMALCFMTACGGGGGGGGTSLKLASTPLASGKVTLSATNINNSSDVLEFGSNGTSTYARETMTSSDEVYLKVNSSLYYIDLDENTVQNISSNSSMQNTMALFEAMLNVKNYLASAKVGTYKISGTEYYSETTTVTVGGNNISFVYCFSGSTLKYIVAVKASSSSVIVALRVNSVKSSVDTSLLTVNGWLASKQITVSISVTPSGSGTVSGDGTYTVGDSVTVKATPNTGYTFVGWKKNGSTVSTSKSYTFTASESVTLTAVFEEDVDPDYAKKSAYQREQIEAINKLRKSSGQNELTWDKQMDEWAQAYLDVWAAYETNQLKDAEYESKANQVMNQYDGVIMIDGNTVTGVCVLCCYGEIDTTAYSGNSVVTKNATYIGNATKTIDGKMYGVVITAR